MQSHWCYRWFMEIDACSASYRVSQWITQPPLVQHPSKIITDIAVPEATIQGKKIHVMKSERIDGELIYSEIRTITMMEDEESIQCHD